MNYTILNILDLINAIGEEDTVSVLSDFRCKINPDIENFVRNNAIDFAKRKISITHLAVDDSLNILAIFALTHKVLEIQSDSLSSSLRRKIERFSQIDDNTSSYTVSAFLIAQFGKNDFYKSAIVGNDLMNDTLNVLYDVQRKIGGGIVYLECKDTPELLDFYCNGNNKFKLFSERYSTKDETNYMQLLRFISAK